MKVENLKGLLKALYDQGKLRQIEKGPRVSVRVGYTAKYAVYVHEMTPLDPHWGRPRRKPHKGEYWDPPGRGQPKFLEKPARDLHNDGTLAKVVEETVKDGGTVNDGLIRAGLRIARVSQRMVPVDLGNLKASISIVSEWDETEYKKEL